MRLVAAPTSDAWTRASGLGLRRHHQAPRPAPRCCASRAGAASCATRGHGASLPRLRRAGGGSRRLPRAAAAGEPRAGARAPEAKRRKVEPGQPWAGVTALAARLKAFGDLPRSSGGCGGRRHAPLRGPLVERGQELPGPPRARARTESSGAGTIAALNCPLAHRVRQIELAMERSAGSRDGRAAAPSSSTSRSSGCGRPTRRAATSRCA